MNSPGDTLAAEELSVGRMTGGWLGGWRVGLETASHRHNLGREGDGPTLFSSRCRPPASYSVGLAFNRFAYPTTKKHCNNRKSFPFTGNFRSSVIICHLFAQPRLQGCISCGILVSGIGARGVSSEHMENMEMFSLSPT